VTVVGNGIAGFACASHLAAAGVPVTMIGPGLPHDRPPLSKRALERGKVPYLTDAADLAKRGIAHIDGLVTDVDLSSQEVRVQPSTGEEPVSVGAERLVWATGVRISRPPAPGADALDTNATAAGLEALLPRLAGGGRRVGVIGAGLIGTETAATLARRHQVTLLEWADRPLLRFTPVIGEAARRALETAGVRFVGGCRVERIETVSESVTRVHTADHGIGAFDVVIAATGVGSTLGPLTGGVPGLTLDTDETLAVVGHRHVWACGDVAAFPHPRYGRISIPHWDNARAGGRHVAEAVIGRAAAYGREPYWFSDIGSLRIQQVGLAAAACEWSTRDGLHVGSDHLGRPACVVLLDCPARLNDARALIAA
jgi:3-phenylpropionate/trans-cinnamate dioxygenase ferredoxin reductase component